MNEEIDIKAMPVWKSILLFLTPSAYFIFITNVVIPYFNN